MKKNRDPRWTDGRFEFVCEQPPENDKVRVEVWSKGSQLSMHSKVMLKNGCLYILFVKSIFNFCFDDNDFVLGLEITLSYGSCVLFSLLPLLYRNLTHFAMLCSHVLWYRNYWDT